MKNLLSTKINWRISLCAILAVLSLVAASCTNTTTSTTASPVATTTNTTQTTTATTTPTTTTATITTATTTTPTAATVLTVINSNVTQTYTVAQLQALQSVTGTGATKNGAGTISATNNYIGVRLTILIKAAGGMTSGEAVRITGQGNYSKTLSYAQVYQGAFNVYDSTGNPATAGMQPFVSIIYTMNGNTLDTTTGPLETGIITSLNQESEASLWIKGTSEIDILPAITLNIAAASSLSNVLKAIDAVYTQTNPNVTISLNTAASGTLQQQIENGAPSDVFLSAAASNMDSLQKENLLVNTSRKNLLNNTLVMVVPNGSTLGLTSFNDLTSSKVTKIAIGDPKSVPAGAYAQSAFDELGITAQIQSKLIQAANVTQVLTYVAGGNVDAGFVYSTDALSSTQVKVVANAPADINAQIVYPEAVLQASKNQDAAQDYLNFLSGSQAKALFIQFGFTMAGN